MSLFSDVKHKVIFEYFEKICAVPHGSGNTKAIGDFYVDFAKSHGLEYYRDSSDNVIIYKKASAGCEDKPTVILQGHSDMVCDSVDAFDFETQGIQVIREGDIIRANGTTLGADNGLSCAMVLAILADDDMCHPALECVFTSNEEIGMFGALDLDYSKLTGKTMFNLDSDGEGIITCGCAGGARCHISLDMTAVSNSKQCHELTIDGLLGGHSGVTIGTNRANAIKLAAKIISEIAPDANIVKISGGSKENAIPSVANVVFATDCDIDYDSVKNAYEKYVTDTFTDSAPSIALKNAEMSSTAFDDDSSAKLVGMLNDMPTGVVEMSDVIEGLVQTSLNCGVINTDGSRIELDVSVRSNVKSRKADIIEMINGVAAKYSASVETDGEYPSWEYKPESKAKHTAIDVYTKMFGKQPKIEVIHAGLECGVFADNIPGLDCIAFGPDLHDIHTVNERTDIGTVCRTFEFLIELLKNI